MVLVYDITEAKSFSKINNWLNRLKEELPNNIPKILIGNKSDL